MTKSIIIIINDITSCSCRVTVACLGNKVNLARPMPLQVTATTTSNKNNYSCRSNKYNFNTKEKMAMYEVKFN